MLRMNENLSACFASAGNNSPISMPLTFVGIALANSPMYSGPDLGLGSHVSLGDIPPHRNIWMTDRALPRLDDMDRRAGAVVGAVVGDVVGTAPKALTPTPPTSIPAVLNSPTRSASRRDIGRLTF